MTTWKTITYPVAMIFHYYEIFIRMVVVLLLIKDNKTGNEVDSLSTKRINTDY